MDHIRLDPTDKQAVLDTIGLVLVIKNFGATRLDWSPVPHVPRSIQCIHNGLLVWYSQFPVW